MTTSLKYIGTLEPYFETAITGKPQGWRRGMISPVSDGDAALLKATGLFMASLSEVDSNADSTDGIVLPAAVQALVSGGGYSFGKLVGDTATSAVALANTAALNSVLIVPGSYQLPSNLGDVFISSSLIIGRDVTLKGGRGTRIRALTGAADFGLMRNANFNSAPFNISALTCADGKSVGATTNTPHGLSVNDYIFVAGALPDAYNGVWKITSTLTATTLTYVITYFNGTQTSVLTTPATINTGTGGVNINVTSSIGSAVLTVTYGPSLKIGMAVAHPNFPAGVTVVSYTQFTVTLSSVATASGPGALTTNIYAYSSIVGMKADYGITLDGVDFYHGWFAGDTPTVSGAISYGNNAFSVYLRRVRALKIINCNFYNCYVAICYGNTQETLISGNGGDNNASMSQGYCGGSDITVAQNRGQAHDDGHSFLQGDWGAWYDPGARFLTDVNRITFRDNKTRGALTQTHCIGQAGVKYGKILVDDCGAPSSGGSNAYLRFDEDEMCGSGASWDSIEVRSPNGGDVVARPIVGIGGSPNSSAAATYRTLRTVGFGNEMADNSTGIAFGENFTLDCWQLCDSHFFGTGGTVCQSFGVNGKPIIVKNVQWSNVMLKGVSYGINTYFTAACNYSFSNLVMDTCVSLIVNLSNSSNKIGLNNVVSTAASGALVHHAASSDAVIKCVGVSLSAGIVSGSAGNTLVFWGQDTGASISGVSPAIDVKNGNVFVHTNSGANPTFVNPVWAGYPGVGCVTIKLILTEDATGNHTYTFGAKFLFTAAFVQPGVGSANKRTLLTFTFDGSNWIQVGSTNVWS